MAFCIECGAKAPEIAKFCPQCGAALVQIETTAEPAPEPVNMRTLEADTLEAVQTEVVIAETSETVSEDTEFHPETLTAEPSALNTVLSAASSLAAAASVAEDPPKSKAGLFIGLGVAALMAAGGGAYAFGLFGGSDKDSEIMAAAPIGTEPAAVSKTKSAETEASDPVLEAYQDAIRTGRISDLGQFANDNRDSSLAKDAETAAFDSLQRQGSVLAYTTFSKYFPEADTATYLGPRVNADGGALPVDPADVEFDQAPVSAPSIRTSIAQRAEELKPFIVQGDAVYSVAVIDEMLAFTDLNEVEATYLLNLRAEAEASRGFSAPAQVEFIVPEPLEAKSVEFESAQPDPVAPIIVPPASAAIATLPETETPLETPIDPEIEPLPILAAVSETLELDPPAVVAEISNPVLKYDTAAKPLERFGAITPEDATQPGECDMAFSIDTSGTPTNIVSNCTDPLFVKPAEETVSEWSYSPALSNGDPVQQDGVIVKIKFHLE